MDKNDLLKYAGEYIKLYPKKETNYFGGEPQIGYLVKTEGDLYLLKETKGVYLYTSGIENVEVVPNAKQESIKKFTEVFNKNEFREKVIEEPFYEAFKKVKPYETRNDRFREFEDSDKFLHFVDAKDIGTFFVMKNQNEKIAIKVVFRNGISNNFWLDATMEEYKSLCEWWKYWKQN